MTSPAHPEPGTGHCGSRPPQPVPPTHDHTDPPATGDRAAELDAALATAAAHLRVALGEGDAATAERLTRWIDDRLDQRNTLTPPP